MVDGTKTISLKVSIELDRQLRLAAAWLDQNRSEFIRETLENRLAELQEHRPDEGEEAIEI